MSNTRLAACIAARLLSPLGPSSAAEPVQVEDHGNGRYTLSATQEGTTDPTHGQLAIVPNAEELCGDLHPHYGQYRFESTGAKVDGSRAVAVSGLRGIAPPHSSTNRRNRP